MDTNSISEDEPPWTLADEIAKSDNRYAEARRAQSKFRRAPCRVHKPESSGIYCKECGAWMITRH